MACPLVAQLVDDPAYRLRLGDIGREAKLMHLGARERRPRQRQVRAHAWKRQAAQLIGDKAFGYKAVGRSWERRAGSLCDDACVGVGADADAAATHAAVEHRNGRQLALGEGPQQVRQVAVVRRALCGRRRN